jgi:hypothetical protein
VPQFLPPEHEPTHVQIAEQGADQGSLRAAEEFQVWKLTVRPDRSATLTCDDGNECVKKSGVRGASSLER